MNIKKQPVTWLEVKCRGALPSPRAYHSAALCESGSTNGMILMFGGRSNKEAVNDIWGLVRHTDGRHEWLKAPQQGNIEPVARYQHACLFYGPFLLIVGGKSDKHDDPLPTQSYDVRSNKWSTFDVIERFRHCAFLT
jgi:protein phosphatase